MSSESSSEDDESSHSSSIDGGSACYSYNSISLISKQSFDAENAYYPSSSPHELFIKRMRTCCVTFYFTDLTKNLQEKENKRQTLLQLLDYVKSASVKFMETVVQTFVEMVSTNIFRDLTPQPRGHKTIISLEEEDTIDPCLIHWKLIALEEGNRVAVDPAWPHSQIVYEIFRRESEGSFQYGNYRRKAEDLRAVVKHFQEEEQRLVLALIGHSKGGNAVLIYASRYHDVPTIVNIAGRFDLKRGIEGRLGEDFQKRIEQYGFIDVRNRRGNIEYRVTKESLKDRLATDTLATCQAISPSCRVLTVHGTKDEFVPVEDATEFAKHIPNHKLHIVGGADHYYTKHEAELNSIVLSFVNTCLASCCRTDKLFNSRM